SYLFYDKRDQSPAPKGLAGPIQERAYYRHNGPGTSQRNAKMAFDAVMVVLFAFTTAATIFWIFKNRKAGAATGTSSNPENPIAPQQTGALPPAPAPGYATTEKPDTSSYSQSTVQEISYPPPQQQQQQQQPQMQRSGHSPEPMQQSQYPIPVPQGAAGDYYNQPQGSAGEYYNQPRSQTQQTNTPPNRAEMPSPPLQKQNVSPIDGH
ncbi:MAG: hypothetical protein Q9224_007286, partial [Gallowayella concinna]